VTGRQSRSISARTAALGFELGRFMCNGNDQEK
jgi:hypothetical protein